MRLISGACVSLGAQLSLSPGQQHTLLWGWLLPVPQGWLLPLQGSETKIQLHPFWWASPRSRIVLRPLCPLS